VHATSRHDLTRPVSFLPLDFTITMAASKEGHPAVYKNSTGPGFSIRIAPRKSVVEILDELDNHASRSADEPNDTDQNDGDEEDNLSSEDEDDESQVVQDEMEVEQDDDEVDEDRETSTAQHLKRKRQGE
jgi:hypothetical protein